MENVGNNVGGIGQKQQPNYKNQSENKFI